MWRFKNKAFTPLERCRRYLSCLRQGFQTGFTLIEVMLAVAILSLGLVLVVRSYLTALEAIKVAQNLSVANLLLEQKLWEKQEEQRRLVEFDLEEEEDKFAAPFEEFSYKMSFEEEDLPADYDLGTLYKSCFVVSWQQRKRKFSTSSLTYTRGKGE